MEDDRKFSRTALFADIPSTSSESQLPVDSRDESHSTPASSFATIVKLAANVFVIRKPVKRLRKGVAISHGCSLNKKCVARKMNVSRDDPDLNNERTNNINAEQTKEDIKHRMNSSFPRKLLRRILNNLTAYEDRKNARLVCRAWCEECVFGKKAKILFNLRTDKREFNYLKNCRFESLSLTFDVVCNLSWRVWQKVGNKIHALRFKDCRITNSVEQHVCCLPNLKLFQMCLTTGTFAFLANYAVLRRVLRICSRFSAIDLVVSPDYTEFTEVVSAGWELICRDYELESSLTEDGNLVCHIPTAHKFDESKFSTRTRNFFRKYKIECYSVSLNAERE